MGIKCNQREPGRQPQKVLQFQSRGTLAATSALFWPIRPGPPTAVGVPDAVMGLAGAVPEVLEEPSSLEAALFVRLHQTSNSVWQ